MIGRPPTSGTRHGNGRGQGPRKGPGRGGPASGTPAGGFGWGGPARGAHPARSRNLPQVVKKTEEAMSDEELEAAFNAHWRADNERWRAKNRALEARRDRLLAYRAAVIWGGQRPRPAFIGHGPLGGPNGWQEWPG